MTELTALALVGSVFLSGFGFYLCLLAVKQRKLESTIRNLEAYFVNK